MKITFQNTNNNEVGIHSGNAIKVDSPTTVNIGKAAMYSQGSVATFLGIEDSEKAKGTKLAEFKQKIENTDLTNLKNYRTVLANTLSPKDYAKACEDGFDMSEMDPEDVVTIVDKIKAELVKAGKNIKGYTDDIDVNTLENALGSSGLANELAKQFEAFDVPVTEENINDIKKAWDMTTSLDVPSEKTYGYMIENNMDSKLWNFYVAQNSGVGNNDDTNRYPRYYAQNVKGYLGQRNNEGKSNISREDVIKILKLTEIEDNEENVKAADFLLSQNVEVNKQNINLFSKLWKVEFPISEEVFAKSAVASISAGDSAIYADFSEATNVYERAASVYDYYFDDDANQKALENIESRIMLENVRLRMTVEVNVKLIQSGFAIDTAPMEELIEALKDAEEKISKQYFPDSQDSVEKYRLLNNSLETLEELPTLPVSLLGSFTPKFSLLEFHQEGTVLKMHFQKANESYEALMTAPRRDLGDTIKNAFRNVDDILEDMNYPLTDENRKTIRILGYNSMEISHENIAKVQNAEKEVYGVIDKMTPASVIKMIRDDKNPLLMSFEELNEYFASESRKYDDEVESFSRYLYQLEKNNNISEAEKESYIGIYRLLHQIEKNDGAVIGAVVNNNATLQFSTLLSAARSVKLRNMDVKIDDNFGAIEELIQNGKPIDIQIARAFTQDVRNILEDALKADSDIEEQYQEMQLDILREAKAVDSEIVNFLSEKNINLSANNLLSADELFNLKDFGERKNVFSKLRDMRVKYNLTNLIDEERASNLIEAVDKKDIFVDEYKALLQDLSDSVEEMSFNVADNHLDVAALKMMHKQLGIAGKISADEEFVIPMYIDSNLSKVHITFKKDASKLGEINISADISEGHIWAKLGVSNKNINGYLSGNTKEAVNRLEEISDIFSTSVKQLDDYNLSDLNVIRISDGSNVKINQLIKDKEVFYEAERTDNSELYRIAKVLLKAMEK